MASNNATNVNLWYKNTLGRAPDASETAYWTSQPANTNVYANFLAAAKPELASRPVTPAPAVTPKPAETPAPAVTPKPAETPAPVVAPEPAKPIDYEAMAASMAAAIKANQAPVTTWTPTSKETTASQLNGLLADDSTYLQQAKTAGLQQAASRGLLNSSMAVGDAQTAAIRSALPIAQSDANMYANAGQYNANAANNMAQFNTTNALNASMFNAGMENDFALANQNAVNEQRKYYADAVNTEGTAANNRASNEAISAGNNATSRYATDKSAETSQYTTDQTLVNNAAAREATALDNASSRVFDVMAQYAKDVRDVNLSDLPLDAKEAHIASMAVSARNTIAAGLGPVALEVDAILGVEFGV